MRGLPEFLDRRDADLRAALRYLTDSAVVQDISPLYHGMYVRHRANVAAVARFLADAASYVSTDATNVRSAIDAYTLADHHATARNISKLDAVLPDFPTRLADPQPAFNTRTSSVTAAVFADR